MECCNRKNFWSFSYYASLVTVLLAAALYRGFAHGPCSLPQAMCGIRSEFILFGLTLLGVAVFHHRTFQVAVTGLAIILAFKLACIESFHLGHHLRAEGIGLLNLFGLLMGFALLSRHFEASKVPELLPRWLPDDWKGGFVLLVMVFVLSSFLDNIAAAMIGGTIAMVVFRHKVHIGFLAAIVAASNAGGAGSVVGDTTTTMMWIDGVSALDVLHAYVGSVVSLFIFGYFAARQQDRYAPITREATPDLRIRVDRLILVVMILAGAILANVFLSFPAAGVWAAILGGAIFCKTDWDELSKALKGSLFLLSLVLCASMMPVEALPAASWQSTFVLGAVSAVFDNIPLTKLTLVQGGYDWGFVAYAVGFGGSMVWFGSSAGVALSNMFPEAKSVGAWVKNGWHVTLAYTAGFLAMVFILGWQPHPPHKKIHAQPAHALIRSTEQPPRPGAAFAPQCRVL